MTARSRFRIAAAVGALIAPLAMVATVSAPADAASAKHKHEIYMYKVEKDLRLAGVGPDANGVGGEQSISCFGTDNALDGMWNVKHVDDFHDPSVEPDPDDDPEFPSTSTLGGIYNDERDVFVEASYPDMTNRAKWNFRFDNRAYGDAQVKIFATCLRDYTEKASGHKHKTDVRGAFYTPGTTATFVSNRWAWDSNWTGFTCLNKEYMVAPGFDLQSTVDDHRLVASYPTNAGRSWAWEFASFDPTGALNPQHLPGGTGPIVGPEQIHFYAKCINRQVLADSPTGHRHAVAMKHLWSGLQNIKVGDPRELQYSCDTDYWEYSAYKAMVGAFYLHDYWWNTWYLGSEPRPKTRVWQFWNTGSSQAKVDLGVLCINSRTANPTI